MNNPLGEESTRTLINKLKPNKFKFQSHVSQKTFQMVKVNFSGRGDSKFPVNLVVDYLMYPPYFPSLF